MGNILLIEEIEEALVQTIMDNDLRKENQGKIIMEAKKVPVEVFELENSSLVIPSIKDHHLNFLLEPMVPKMKSMEEVSIDKVN